MLNIQVEFLDSVQRDYLLTDRDNFDISEDNLTLYNEEGKIIEYFNLQSVKQISFVDLESNEE